MVPTARGRKGLAGLPTHWAEYCTILCTVHSAHCAVQCTLCTVAAVKPPLSMSETAEATRQFTRRAAFPRLHCLTLFRLHYAVSSGHYTLWQ
jgi:hypothetical protein